MSSSTFIKGTLILTIATLFSKILGSVFRIPLQNIAGDQVLGIFSLVYPVYMVALTLSVAGIPIAISKIIAEERAKRNTDSIKEIYVTASVLAILFGIGSFILIYCFSEPIANALGGQSTRLALIVVAATLIIAPYMAVYRGYFQGFGDMAPTAISQVIEQFVRVALLLTIAFLFVKSGLPDEKVAGGLMAGSVFGALCSFIYLRFQYDRSPLKQTSSRVYSSASFTYWSRKILKLSIPIAFGAITMALINFVDSFTISYSFQKMGLDESDINYMYGLYGRGQSLVQIATVLATSLVLPLIPLLTTKLKDGNKEQVSQIIGKTNWLTHLVSWPAALGLLALTLPINLALFTDIQGSWVLAVIGFSSIFTSLTVLSTGILQGMNAAKMAAVMILIAVVLKAVVNIYLVQAFGLLGAAFSTLAIYIILFVLNTFAIYKKARFTLEKTSVMKIMTASVFMGAVIGIPTLFLDIANWSRFQALSYTFVGIVIGTVIYIALLLLLNVISKQDIKRTLSGALPSHRKGRN